MHRERRAAPIMHADKYENAYAEARAPRVIDDKNTRRGARRCDAAGPHCQQCRSPRLLRAPHRAIPGAASVQRDCCRAVAADGAFTMRFLTSRAGPRVTDRRVGIADG